MSEKVCVFGEVLFDVFPGGEALLGGAPFNVAWHLQAFSQAPFFISRVGNDAEGIQIRKAMLDWGMDTLALQIDEQLSTGRVNIELYDGEPKYDIVEPVAYDAIEELTGYEAVCRFLYHGSLAVRNKTSLQALEQLKTSQTKPTTVFVDVNLRNPWWDKNVVCELMRTADWVKLNTEEFNLLYASDKAGKNKLSAFIDEYDLQGVILTHGSAGAEINTAQAEYHEVKPDIAVDVVDSVGAGDAFSAVTIMGLINNWPLKTTIQRAQDFASAIVGQRGATVADKNFYQAFLNAWDIR
jgi:fructokinase